MYTIIIITMPYSLVGQPLHKRGRAWSHAYTALILLQPFVQLQIATCNLKLHNVEHMHANLTAFLSREGAGPSD